MVDYNAKSTPGRLPDLVVRINPHNTSRKPSTHRRRDFLPIPNNRVCTLGVSR
jgi:hypothetical protein